MSYLFQSVLFLSDGMNTQARVFVLLASVLFAAYEIQTGDSAGYDYCYNFPEYHTLIDLTRHDKCMNIDSVFKLLADLTTKQGSGSCRIHAIAVLSDHVGSHARTPDYCHCSGVNRLQLYHMGRGDGVTDQWRHCLHVDPNYTHLYNEFFENNQHTDPPVCRTHHSLWNTLKSTNAQDLGDGNSCQKDIIFHLRYAFQQHTDGCFCSETTTAPSTTVTTTTKTTTTPKTTTTITTTTRTTPPPNKYTCNKFVVVEDIAMAVHTGHPNSSPCDQHAGGYDDALVLSTCNTSSPNTWRQGQSVVTDCRSGTHSIPPFTPISTFNNGYYSPGFGKSGVFLECRNNVIKMVIQNCNSAPGIIEIDTRNTVRTDMNLYVIV